MDEGRGKGRKVGRANKRRTSNIERPTSNEKQAGNRKEKIGKRKEKRKERIKDQGKGEGRRFNHHGAD